MPSSANKPVLVGQPGLAVAVPQTRPRAAGLLGAYSLKARLRIAIAFLMACVVVVLTLLYIHGFLGNEFQRTRNIAKSLTGQVQSAIAAILEARTPSPPPASREEVKRLWLGILEKDPAVTGVLKRALESWDLISQIYITAEDGRILASSDPSRVGQIAKPVADFDDWTRRSLLTNLSQVYLAKEDTERVQTLGLTGEDRGFVTLHLSIPSALLRDSMRAPLDELLVVFLIALVTSILLGILLPNLVLNPIGDIVQQIERMATGDYAVPVEPSRVQAKEFAAVYSKLEMLGQQFQGARENADDLRTNVEQLLERMEQAVLMTDPAGRLIMAGKNASSLLGSPASSLVGRMVSDLFPPGSQAEQSITEILRDRQPVRDRLLSFETPDGERNISLTFEPLLRAPEHRPMGYLLILKDPESRGEIEAELGLAGRLSALSQLTRGVAHEIKNPLNAITLHLEILRGKLAEDAPEVDVIGREISRLDRVVKTFLDFNRPVEPQMRRVDLSEIGRDIVNLLRPQAASKNVQMVVDCPGKAIIEGDHDLLQQAILNVVMNGIEAMENGGTLTVRTGRSGGLCVLSVCDTGPGIPQELRDRIFSLYFSTKRQGSGIGLALAFRFVQLHNGSLDFSSEAGKGTIFRFSFPEALSVSRNSLSMLRTHG